MDFRWKSNGVRKNQNRKNPIFLGYDNLKNMVVVTSKNHRNKVLENLIDKNWF